MHSTADTQSIATAKLYSHLERQVNAIAPERRPVRTPQRRANYKDKARLRLKDLKQTAFAEYKCSSSAQIKEYLKFLRLKIDLRLTSAWDAIVFELRSRILAAKAILEAIESQPIDNGVQTMLAAMKEAIARSCWNPVKTVLATHSEYKDEAWKQLSVAEKQQLSALVPEQVLLLTQAKRSGAIVRFEEDPCGLIYWVWRSNDSKPELVTSCYVKTFLRNLATSNLNSPFNARG